MIRSRVSLIPATDDLRYVPEITLRASADGAVVRAHAVVRGGTPPYTYIWGGSDERVSRSTGDAIEYTAQARATDPVMERRAQPIPVNGLLAEWVGRMA